MAGWTSVLLAASNGRTEREVAGSPDGIPLRIKPQQVKGRHNLRIFILVLPLFILIAFVLPLGRMMSNAIHDDPFLSRAGTMAALRA
ncbi:hypothetical protein ABIC03_007853 [Bradyrhizobium sp. RT6a]